eukprot:CAMPEP_0113500064 /NCGR_PEP_ID=MMETSP0014_2-20120614/32101_1 /TAXON_ID=2857 /ORGANISM="Nitzschia sp." /LENGTH=975 /DNA_ID=CAMNT_0000394319 /DNA_START=48 /DNA_END=2975 /DNA_ORIENTATION=- /assembly_acc=CAM_ASM_000159
MPRSNNKMLMKKRGGGGGASGSKTSSNNKPKIIKIKPFTKPPALPPNYYDQTSKELLEGTLDCVFAATTSSSTGDKENSDNGGSSSSSNPLSLQNAYQQVVNLVSHQYGPQLYKDLISTMKYACQHYVLPDDDPIVQSSMANYGNSNNNNSNNNEGGGGCGGNASTTTPEEARKVLQTIQTKYQKYVDYLLLCKHIFLPLDSSHVFNQTTGQVLSLHPGNNGSNAAGSNGSNAASSAKQQLRQAPGSSSAMTMMGLWQVGLEQFKQRLLEFHLDDIIYQKWWESLKMDWNNNGTTTTTDDSNDASALSLEHQTLLQDTLYMWQDLNMLSDTLATRLEPDLIAFLKSKSEMLKTTSTNSSSGVSGAAAAAASSSSSSSSSSYNPTSVIAYCYSKWMHVAYNWNRFLPKATCIFLLENYLFKPHLRAEYILDPTKFDLIIESAFTSSSSSSIATASNASANSISGTTAPTGVVSTSSPIQQLWMLSGRLPGGYKQVGEAIARYARQRGMTLMVSMGNGNIDPQKMPAAGNTTKSSSTNNRQKIGQLLELQRNIQVLLSQLSHSDEYCLLKPVWEDVVNPAIGDDHDEGTNLVADALAKYVDSCLKDNKRQLSLPSTSGSPAAAADPLNDNWGEAIINGIFCFLQAKDVFEGFYKKDLAKRLLGNRVVSMDVERHFVSLLKAQCGPGYTSKMEGMFQDMDWSRETTNMYKDSLYKDTDGSTKPKDIEMDIQVLTTGYWPVYPQYPNLILPDEMKAPQEHFAEYYKSKYQGRRMTWQYAIGQMVVRFQPRESGPKYDLLVSPTQALVLTQFNTNGEMNLPQIMAAVGLDDRSDAELILLGLSLGKDGTRVLQKIDHDADEKKKTRPTVHHNDTFRVRDTFKSNARRIKINNILMKETKEERDKTMESVSRDRFILIDAVLVRIMKARKSVLHKDLIPQVLEQLKFPAQPADIKKRIEILIEREYMERDAADRNRYTYLA